MNAGVGKTTSKKFAKGAIQPRQIKAIHAAASKAGLDDDAYRGLLLFRYNATSCKQLTWRQAEELLDHLNGKAGQTPKYKTLQYSDLDGRPGFANGAQCRLLAAMFAQVSRVDADDELAREKALNSFCARIAGVAGLRMVRTFQVEKIVKALEAMGAVKKEGAHGCH
jgi:hypothetical protein